MCTRGEKNLRGFRSRRQVRICCLWRGGRCLDSNLLPGNSRSFATDPADRSKIWVINDGGSDFAFGYDPIEGILTYARIPFLGLPATYLEEATHLEVKRFGQSEVRMTATVPEALVSGLGTVYYSANGAGFEAKQVCSACESLRRSIPHPIKDRHAFLLCDTAVGPSVFEQDLDQTKICNPVIWGSDLTPRDVRTIATSIP